MDREKLKNELRRDEGLRLETYRCPAGYRTIGYGHLAGNGPDICTIGQAEEWLSDDIIEAVRVAERFVDPVNLYALAELRQRALVNLAFNLGNRLKEFRRMRFAIQDDDWNRAAKELESSRYARQVGQRAARLAQMFRKGSDERE